MPWFFFAASIRHHQRLFGLLRDRHPRLFEGAGGHTSAEGRGGLEKARAKRRWRWAQEVLYEKREDLNAQAFMVCKRLPSEVDRLLGGTAENYYQTVSTFVRLSDLQQQASEIDDNDGG